MPSKKKVWDSVDEAVKDVKSGDIILSGGASRVLTAYAGSRVASRMSDADGRRFRTVWYSRDTH